MKRFIKDSFLYLATGLLVFILLIMIQPAMIRRLPNDFSRHRVIIEALKDTSKQPDILFLGNSLSMFGINASTITASIANKPIVYNLSSVGQSIFEGAYFISSVPKKTKQVFQCLDYLAFTQNSTALQGPKAMSMILQGYHIDSTTKEILKNTNAYFDTKNWQVALAARGNLRSSLHNYLRKYLDYEKFDTNFLDLYFPHIYLSERHPRYPNISNDINYDSLPVREVILSLASRINSTLKKRDIQYHIVLMPVNPEIYTLRDSLCRAYMQQIHAQLPGVDIIDLSKALPPGMFYDAIHANKKGAEVLSQLLADRIKKLSEK